MRRQLAQRARRGFTMMETLIVVGVLVVVSALAVPNVIDAQKSLRMTELDAKAEQIYNAAQYQLAAMKAAGRLSVFESDEATAEVLPLPTVPADYSAGDGEDGAAAVDTLRFVTSAAHTTQAYILSSSTAAVSNGVTNGEYAIEFSPYTGEVYAVFYWETDAVAVDGADPETPEAYYRKVCGYRSNPTGSAFRADHRIGYYNGGGVSIAQAKPDDPAAPEGTPFNLSSLSLDLLNEEELYIKIYNPDGSLADTDFDPSKLKLSIFIQELDVNRNINDPDSYSSPSKRALVNVNGGVVRNDIPSVPSGNTIDGGTLSFASGLDTEIDYILDSLYKDASGNVMSFANLTNGKIRPGANVAITVYAQYEDQHWKKGPKTVNSTFDDYYIEKDENGAGIGVIEVSSLRHLENMATTPVDGGGDSIKYQVVKLTEDVTFDGTHWDPESVATSAHRSRENKNPLYADGAYTPMAPIVMQDYFNSGADRTFDGDGHTLTGFVIGSPDSPVDDAGLFSHLKANVCNLELVDCTVYGRDNVGMLAGFVENAGLAFSNVKVTGGTVNGRTNVGGLVGRSYVSDFDNCSSTADVSSEGGSATGGMFGFVEGGVLSSCSVGSAAYAGSATTVTSTGSRVGGFVGAAKSATIQDCSSTANVSAGAGGYAGGFAGAAENCTVKGCTAGYLAYTGLTTAVTSSGSCVGGFVGGLDVASADTQWPGTGGSITECTAYADVTGNDYVGGFVGYVKSGLWVKVSSCAALASYDSNRNPVLHTASGRDYVGGFGGSLATVNELNDHTAQLNVTASGNYAGGFAGLIYQCWPNGCVAQKVDDGHVPTVRCAGANVENFATIQNGGAANCDGSTVNVVRG